ncbi:DNA recombination protein RmuC [Alphaproteobacteria bacterium]|nr:DNA recombination protein RmuC [Alphaproteobacteria bacterium]
MKFELLVVTLLVLIFTVLFFLLVISIKKNKKSGNDDIQKIEKHLNSLLHKTIEQSGYINSKIDEIGDLTKKMTNAMTTNISDMGQMGEVILENILQDCGMTKNRDYKTQYTDYNEDGQQFRPDVVVFLPENRNIIIDSKVPMKDWYEFQNSESESSKQTSIMNFSNSIKNHINQIKKKDYTKLLSINSPDYIFIFMPHEFALTTAQKYDTSIASYAQQKNVIIVGPSTLILCMKLVESIWKLEKQNNNSKEIADIAGGMYDQIAKTINLLDKTHSSLSKSLENVEDTKKYIKDGRGSLFSKANKMKELGVNTKEPIK